MTASARNRVGRVCLAASFLGLLVAAAAAQTPARDSAALDQLQGIEQMSGVRGMDDMEGMSAHLRLTAPRPAAPGDAAAAAAIVATLQRVLPAWRDYHAAVAAGFQPFAITLDELQSTAPPPPGASPLGDVIHFTLPAWALEAQYGFNPAHPTSLLYRRLGPGKLELVGAMYTAPPRLTPDQLNLRVPLSIARWHQHVDLCLPPRDQFATADWRRFGPQGNIVTAAACTAAGGTFYPRLFGWMVHVYPFADTPDKIWAH